MEWSGNMTKRDKNRLLKYWKDKPTEEIESEYYSICYGDYNADTERMYDLGFDLVDILEAEAYSNYKQEEAGILEGILRSRGIIPWEDLYEKM